MSISRDKFHGGKILSVISLLPGGCLSTVKYGTVWCGNKRDSFTAYGRLYYSALASFFIAFLSTGSLPMESTSFYHWHQAWPWDLTKVSGRWEVIYVMSKKLWKPLHELTLAHFRCLRKAGARYRLFFPGFQNEDDTCNQPKVNIPKNEKYVFVLINCVCPCAQLWPHRL